MLITLHGNLRNFTEHPRGTQRSSGESMPRKKVDNRIRVLVENGVNLRQRTMFVIVGDKGKDQVRRLKKLTRYQQLLKCFRCIGGHPSPRAVQGTRESASQRTLVL